jgi:hypothetical protein
LSDIEIVGAAFGGSHLVGYRFAASLMRCLKDWKSSFFLRVKIAVGSGIALANFLGGFSWVCFV